MTAKPDLANTIRIGLPNDLLQKNHCPAGTEMWELDRIKTAHRINLAPAKTGQVKRTAGENAHAVIHTNDALSDMKAHAAPARRLSFKPAQVPRAIQHAMSKTTAYSSARKYQDTMVAMVSGEIMFSPI